MKKVLLVSVLLIYATLLFARAAANSFILTRPDTRYGDSNGSVAANELFGSRFTVPGSSGTVSIEEVGNWGSITNTRTQHIAIFTDDAANVCPEAKVDNSDVTISVPGGGTYQIGYSTYSTKPVLIAGQNYWICILLNSSTEPYSYSRFATGGVSIIATGLTYPTYPSGDEWHAFAEGSRDNALYAIYTVDGAVGAAPKRSLLGVGRDKP